MSDFYQLTNSTSDFKSRSSDVFDKLSNLEKQHDVNTKTQTPISVPDEETPSSSHQNPTIPRNAITFKKRPADDTFARPTDKWKKYDLDDVNEHHTSNTGNRHALNDFLRTRVKPSDAKETDEDKLQSTPPPVFKRPMKKQILTNDADEDNQFISIRAPLPTNTTVNENDDETTDYKLTSIRKKPRGVVLNTSEKKSMTSSLELSEEKDNDDDDDVNDEFFEP